MWHPSSISSATSRPRANQVGDCLVDMRPLCLDFVQCRPRDHAAPRTLLPRLERLAVGIEQECERLIEWPVALQMSENDRHKKQVACVRCQFAGLASVIDCTVASASERGSPSYSRVCRTYRWNRSRSPERERRLEKMRRGLYKSSR